MEELVARTAIDEEALHLLLTIAVFVVILLAIRLFAACADHIAFASFASGGV